MNSAMDTTDFIGGFEQVIVIAVYYINLKRLKKGFYPVSFKVE